MAAARGVLPMYSCCRRAIARQAAAGLKHGAADSQVVGSTVAATGHQQQFKRLLSTQISSDSPATILPEASTSSSSITRSQQMQLDSRRSTSTAPMHYQPSEDQVTSHLNTLFEGIQPAIPSELAVRMITHKGSISPNATKSTGADHNAKLSLIGRRVLRLYLAVFLHAHGNDAEGNPIITAESSLNDIVERLANTHTLGRFVAPRWNLERNMNWRQMIGPDGRPTGLEKISGQAVEAILGGLYRQYGAAIAMQVFNSRVLPFLPLPTQLREPAIQLAQRHGDLSGSFSLSS